MMASSETAPGAAGSRLRPPDFFIVGQAKSGTTALYEMLRRHPQIYMPDNKEPWFFATDMRPRFQTAMMGPLPETLEEYLMLFAGAGAGQQVGEASTSYLWSRTAAERIAEVQPAGRIIAILREPASFLRSLHLQLIQTHVESERDLGKAMALEGQRREGRHIPRRSHRPQLLQYSDHVRYVEQLKRYEAVFPAEQMLILIYDDFRRDNEATVREVWRFLGVDDRQPVAVLDANPSVSLRSHGVDELVHAVSVGRNPVSRTAKNAFKALTPRRARREILQWTLKRVVHRSTPPPDEALMLDLRRRFKGEVVALSEHLGRDLVKLWGYDEVA
jgi:hypothetical protein